MFSTPLFVATALALVPTAFAAHAFTFKNNCGYSVNPVIADTRCGYSPRCDGSSSFTGAQPGTIGAGGSKTVSINSAWVGRIFNQNGACGAKGEGCTLLEYNLDTGDFYTPNAYDISNIQGYTQSIGTGASGCDWVACTSASCSCSQAYPIGDTSGCGNDSPVRACGAGDVGFQVTFCP